MKHKCLDTKTILTVEHLDNCNFVPFLDQRDKTWVRYIKYPISQDELNRLCKLSRLSSKTQLYNSMGELYVRRT